MKIKASELVEDFDLYPRADVDSTHVSHIAQAIEAGVEMPPIRADIRTKRIVDGFHRRRAYIRVYGDAAEVEALLKPYKSESELFLEAMRLNANHGRNMTSFDRTHAIEKAMRFEIDPALIATALNMKIERVTEFKTERCAKLENSRRVVPLKQSIRHMRGHTMTKEQCEIVPKLGGNNQSFYVTQLILLIDNGMMDMVDEKLVERLGLLHGKLGKLLKKI